jgi:hypothetical protein
MRVDFPSEIMVRAIKSGWFRYSYQFIANDKIIGQLDFKNFYSKNATVSIDAVEFSIRRSGVWKHNVEVTSPIEQYNLRIPLTWRNTMKVTDSSANSYVFKSTSVWKSKWEWFDRHERPQMEILSKSLSRKGRGLIKIKEAEMKDILFWLIVSWYVIVCSESDAAVVAAS